MEARRLGPDDDRNEAAMMRLLRAVYGVGHYNGRTSAHAYERDVPIVPPDEVNDYTSMRRKRPGT